MISLCWLVLCYYPCLLSILRHYFILHFMWLFLYSITAYHLRILNVCVLYVCVCLCTCTCMHMLTQDTHKKKYLLLFWLYSAQVLIIIIYGRNSYHFYFTSLRIYKYFYSRVSISLLVPFALLLMHANLSFRSISKDWRYNCFFVFVFVFGSHSVY